MNLFLIGWRAEGGLDAAPARAALAGLLERLGLLDPAGIETWTAPSGRCVLACAAHVPEQLGGVRYTALEPERMALFSGRPFRWTGAGESDGLGPLDPAAYLPPAGGWAGALDGRFAAARYDDADGALEVVTDPLGGYPVFAAERGGARWVSNNPELLRDGGTPRPEVLASLLGGGWSLGGDPLHAGVDRLPRGTVHRMAPGAARERRELLPLEEIVSMCGTGFDAGAAAGLLVASLRGLAGWPGRPDVVPVTGGRDSRLVLAAALAAGIDFEATTGGPDEHPDVAIGRELCRAAGIPHVALAGDPHGDMWTHPRRMAEVVGLVAGGTACVADAAGFPLGPRDGPLVLWHSGQGGEVARGYYGQAGGDVAGRLYRAFVGRRPGRAELLSAAGRALVRGEIEGFVKEVSAAGARPEDVPDLFYLLRRMGTWAGPTHACVELVKDTTSPLWSARLLHQLLGLPAHERARELFHLRVLERLAPELVEVPFEGGRSWPRDHSALRRRADRARGLARKVGADLRRRAPRRAQPPAPATAQVAADPFAAVHADVAETVRSAPSHPAWEVLDRPRVERLLARDPAGLDTMSRYYVWRLGQVFWEGERATRQNPLS
ncbi:MAG: hypothetical protein WD844_16775 [Thermoleophilaceae bacterium]